MNLVSSVTTLLSVFTIIAQILIILGLINYFFPKRVKPLDDLFKKIFPLVFVVPLVAMAGSLFFSEVAHYVPCILCWYQRIVMYPQAIILTIAYFRKDKNLAIYTIALSLIGAIISTYHYLLQIQAIHEIVPCTTTVVAVDCSQKIFMTFGYITIPMMALSAFLLTIVLQVHNLRKK